MNQWTHEWASGSCIDSGYCPLSRWTLSLCVFYVTQVNSGNRAATYGGIDIQRTHEHMLDLIPNHTSNPLWSLHSALSRFPFHLSTHTSRIVGQPRKAIRACTADTGQFNRNHRYPAASIGGYGITVSRTHGAEHIGKKYKVTEKMRTSICKHYVHNMYGEFSWPLTKAV